MRKIIIDTNGFLRLFLNDIPGQANKIESLLVQAKKGTVHIYIPQIIVFEIYFALTKYYKTTKEDGIDKLKSLVSADYIEVESKDIFISALTLYSSASVSFVDCFLLAKTQAEQAELFTFDRKLKRVKEKKMDWKAFLKAAKAAKGILKDYDPLEVVS